MANLPKVRRARGRPKGSKSGYNLSPEGLKKKQAVARQLCKNLRDSGRAGSGYFATHEFPEWAKKKVRDGLKKAIREGRFNPADNMRKFIANGASEAFLAPRNGKHRHGMFKSKKNGKKLRYDSSWELVRMKTLEASSDVESYRKNPVSIPYKLNGKAHYYWPDFLVEYKSGEHVLEEVKPEWALERAEVKNKFKAAKAFCKTAGIQFRVCSSLQSLQEI